MSSSARPIPAKGDAAMLDKLIAIEAKYSQIEARLAAPETYDDPA